MIMLLLFTIVIKVHRGFIFFLFFFKLYYSFSQLQKSTLNATSCLAPPRRATTVWRIFCLILVMDKKPPLNVPNETCHIGAFMIFNTFPMQVRPCISSLSVFPSWQRKKQLVLKIGAQLAVCIAHCYL